jgi:5-methylcytosine-specific restriction endonuclease McrA
MELIVVIPSPCVRCGGLDGHEPDCDRNAKKSGKRKLTGSAKTRWNRLSARLRQRAGACERCGSTQDLTVDHLWPVSLRPDLAWDEEWMRVLCRSCNSKRGNALPTEAEIAAQELLIEVRRAARDRT